MRFHIPLLSSVCLLVALSFCQNTLAASSSIMSDRNNECAIYLCLPQGFAVDECKTPLKLFLTRISLVTPAGNRIFTDLPAFNLCVDATPAGLPEYDPSQQSSVDYRGAYEVHMPQINTCTRWASRQLTENSSVTYCAAVSTTQARVFESSEPKHPYKTINVGDTTYTQGFAPVKHFTEVIVDGTVAGNRYYSK